MGKTEEGSCSFFQKTFLSSWHKFQRALPCKYEFSLKKVVLSEEQKMLTITITAELKKFKGPGYLHDKL